MAALCELLREAEISCIEVQEKGMPEKIKGLYGENNVWLNKNISTTAEKICILAEELGHHYTTSGDILDQSKIENRKKEIIARRWAYRKLVPLESLIEAYWAGISSRYELAEFLEVTEEFLEDAIKYYKDKYGLYHKINSYVICFEPLGIFEFFNDESSEVILDG